MYLFLVGWDNDGRRYIRSWMEFDPPHGENALFQLQHISANGLGISGRHEIWELSFCTGSMRKARVKEPGESWKIYDQKADQARNISGQAEADNPQEAGVGR